MSEPFAGVCIVGIVIGVIAICTTCFGAMYFERRLHLRIERTRLDLEIEAQGITPDRCNSRKQLQHKRPKKG